MTGGDDTSPRTSEISISPFRNPVSSSSSSSSSSSESEKPAQGLEIAEAVQDCSAEPEPAQEQSKKKRRVAKPKAQPRMTTEDSMQVIADEMEMNVH